VRETEYHIEQYLEKVVKQNYEGIFLVGKTPKKSPSKKQIAILKGIHHSFRWFSIKM
jgi:hypothetical protein